MSNIISSDFFRLRKGATLYATILGLLACVVLIVVVTATAQSPATADMVTGMEGLSEEDRIELQQDFAEAQDETAYIDGGAAIGSEMLTQSVCLLFFLPVVIAVFCADFVSGTYRNTLSYETNCTRVYFAKLALSAVICIAMIIVMLVFGWILGSIVLGATGFSGAYFASTLLTLLLQLPIYLAAVAIGHFLVALTKSSSATIAIFIIGFFAVSIAFPLLAGSISGLEWLALLEPQTAATVMMQHATASASDIIIVAGYHLALIVIATVVGVLHFRKTDMP